MVPLIGAVTNLHGELEMKYLFVTSDNYHSLRYRIYESGTRKHLSLKRLWSRFKAVHHLSDNYSPDHEPDEIEYFVNCFHFTGHLELMTGEVD